MLKEKDRREIAAILSDLPAPVRLVFFTQDFECEYCGTTRDLLAEMASLSSQLSVETHDFIGDKDLAAKLGVDKIPAIVIQSADGRDHGIRLFGVPAGYEFASLLEGIKLVASGDANLEEATVAALKGLHVPVRLEVFATPT